MCEYGFQEGKDYCSFLSESTGGRPSTDHDLSIPMAKELCMLQRSEMGRKFRQYFIAVEEAWNSPEKIIERALAIARQKAREAERRIFTFVEKCKTGDERFSFTNSYPLTAWRDFLAGWAAG
jgi:anti-repressor protein